MQGSAKLTGGFSRRGNSQAITSAAEAVPEKALVSIALLKTCSTLYERTLSLAEAGSYFNGPAYPAFRCASRWAVIARPSGSNFPPGNPNRHLWRKRWGSKI